MAMNKEEPNNELSRERGSLSTRSCTMRHNLDRDSSKVDHLRRAAKQCLKEDPSTDSPKPMMI
jgi:hypothetical protein